jgi:FG-GAP-like repeat
MIIHHLCFGLLLLNSFLLAQNDSPSHADPVPLIYQPLRPTSVKPGGQAFKLTVRGTGFTAHSVVNWNGSPLRTARLGSSELSAVVPASFVNMPGTASVKVSTSAGSGVTSNAQFFTISNPVVRPKFRNFELTTVFAGVYALTTADLNGDGNLDIAGVVPGDNMVFVMLGNGDGTFQQAVSFPVGNEPITLVAADFNRDGILDLATGNELDGTLSVLLGNGDGTFQAQTVFATAAAPFTLFAADLNGDGKLDLVVGSQSGPPGVVSVLLGRGDGTFRHHVEYGTGGSTVDAMTVGDFNRDGILDLVVFDHNINSASVLLGIGNGDFEAPTFVKFPTAASFKSAVAADFNNDGKLDLAVAWEYEGYSEGAFVLLGDGKGGFPVIHNHQAGRYPMGIGLGDFNADGILDLMVSNIDSDNISILLGREHAKFRGRLDYKAGSQAFGVAVGDFNNDGRLDVAVPLPNGGYSSIAVLLQE